MDKILNDAKNRIKMKDCAFAFPRFSAMSFFNLIKLNL